MKQSLGLLFSYLFMTSIVIIILSAFATTIIGVRYFVTSIGEQEIKLWKKFVTILILASISSPILLHLNRKMEVDTKKRDDIF